MSLELSKLNAEAALRDSEMGGGLRQAAFFCDRPKVAEVMIIEHAAFIRFIRTVVVTKVGGKKECVERDGAKTGSQTLFVRREKDTLGYCASV